MRDKASALLGLVAIIVVAITATYGAYLYWTAAASDRQVDAFRRNLIATELAAAREDYVREFERQVVNDRAFKAGLDAAGPTRAACGQYGDGGVFSITGVLDDAGRIASLCEYGFHKEPGAFEATARMFRLGDLAWAQGALERRREASTAFSEFTYRDRYVAADGRLYLVMQGLLSPRANARLSGRETPAFGFAIVSFSEKVLPKIAATAGIDTLGPVAGGRRAGGAALHASEAADAPLLGWPQSRSYRAQLARSAPAFLLLSLSLLVVLLAALRRIERLHRQVSLQEQEARRAALHDSMTGLPNRAYFGELKQAALAEATPVAPLYVGLLDIDFFKQVNDQHGHDVGDMLIKEVAARLAAALGPDATVARLGGDEFAFLVPHRGHRGDILALLKDAHAELCRPMQVGALALQPSVSIGVAGFDGAAAVSGEQILKQADLALYEAKRAGRGRFRMFGAPTSARTAQDALLTA